MIHNEVVAEGQSSSGRYAKVKASSNALSILEGLTASEFRERYQCRCKPLESDKENEHDEKLEMERKREGKEVGASDGGEAVDPRAGILDEIGVAI